MSELKEIARSMAETRTKREWDELEPRCLIAANKSIKEDHDETATILRELGMLKVMKGFAA